MTFALTARRTAKFLGAAEDALAGAESRRGVPVMSAARAAGHASSSALVFGQHVRLPVQPLPPRRGARQGGGATVVNSRRSWLPGARRAAVLAEAPDWIGGRADSTTAARGSAGRCGSSSTQVLGRDGSDP